MERNQVSRTVNNRVDPDTQYGVVVIDARAVLNAAHREAELDGPFHSLLNQVFSIQRTVEAATTEINADNLAVAETEHETARIVAREALDRYNTAANAELRYKNQLQKAIDSRTNAIAHLNALKDSKPNAKLFPSPAEIRAWEDSVTAAQNVVDEKVAEFNSASQSVQMYYLDLNQMGVILNAASEKEMQLRLKVSTLKGIPNTAADSKTGLGGAIR